MMRRFCLAVTLLLAWNAVAHAEWYAREDAIMGTRIAVEVWHDDPAAAERAIDAVIAEMHRIDALMSVYKEDSQVSRVNRDAAAGPVKVDPELARADLPGARVLRDVRRRLRHHLRERRLPVRLPRPHTPDRLPDKGRVARDQLASRRGGPGRLHDPLHAAGGAHRPRRDRQGLCRRHQHRDPRQARHHERHGDGGRRQPDPRRPPRAPLDRRHPPPGRPQQGDRAHPARGRGHLDLRRLRALFRRGRGALPPHHRPEDGQEPARHTQRHRHRPDFDDRRRPHEKRLHHGTGARACAHRCAAGRGCGRRDRGGEGALLEGAGAAE